MRAEGNVGYLLRGRCKVEIHGDKMSPEKDGSILCRMVLCVVGIMDNHAAHTLPGETQSQRVLGSNDVPPTSDLA